MNYLVLAIARFKMTESEEAGAALAKASDIIHREFPSFPNRRSVIWRDVLAMHVLLREAKALIEPDVAPPAV